jgi:hypothetical protein
MRLFEGVKGIFGSVVTGSDIDAVEFCEHKLAYSSKFLGGQSCYSGRIRFGKIPSKQVLYWNERTPKQNVRNKNALTG